MTKELENKIARMEPKMQKAVLRIREIHACLMELDIKNTIRELQEKAVLLNYLSGEGRMFDSVPHTYRVPDGKGGYNIKETYFKYKN